ncbi:hypothetical protein SAMN05216570_3369 [Dyella sp. OK004]|uniref:hypothetical protein n=1 Tax=Dyella sp. OK004 TaxID=1855292 RepID=UPI0008EA563C|nr:hypothetical protein [Dyella sp. OK004]SFS16731.1 hypothetical protein SAMN05216570_3369 [Dyella sp. OK004]
MSDVIEFLEKMGRDAQLRHASSEDMELALDDAQIDAPLSSAILARDISALYDLLQLQPMFATQMEPGEEEEAPSREEEPGKEEEDAPSQDVRLANSRLATVAP